MCGSCRQLAKQDDSVPESFRQAWQQAVKSRSKSAKGALFQKFLQAGGDWSMILAYKLDVAVISYRLLATEHWPC